MSRIYNIGMRFLWLVCFIFLCSCNNNQEIIDELKEENSDLREKISELELEKEDLEAQIEDFEGQITELQEKLESAQSSLDDAKADFLNGNFRMGMNDIDDAEDELNY